MMRRIPIFPFVLLILLSIIPTIVNNQSLVAQTSVGFRLGIGNIGVETGLTVKHQFKESAAIEGIISKNKYDWRATALYEYHYPLHNLKDGLQIYGGGGAHFGKTSKNLIDRIGDIINGEPTAAFENNIVLGLDAIAGVQYDIPRLPINVSFDLKPALNLTNHPRRFEMSGAVSVRFSFGAGGGKGSNRGNSSGKTGKSGSVKGSTNKGVGSNGSSPQKRQGTLKSNGQQNKSKGSQTTTPTKRQGSLKGGQKTGNQSQSGTKQSGKIKDNNKTKTNPNTNPTSSEKQKGTIKQGTIKPKPTPQPSPKPKPTVKPNPNNQDHGSDKDKGSNEGESWREDG